MPRAIRPPRHARNRGLPIASPPRTIGTYRVWPKLCVVWREAWEAALCRKEEGVIFMCSATDPVFT